MEQLYRCRVIAGRHVEGGRRYKTGDIVVSKTNLAERYNTPGAIKFEFLGTATPTQAVQAREAAEPVEKKFQEPAKVEEVVEEQSTTEQSDLSTLTIEKLRELATEEEIDLGDAVRKAEIVSAIELARKAKG